MEVVVTGIGLVSCLGSLWDTWQNIIAGSSGIKQYQPFAELPPLPLGLINTQPIDLKSLTKIAVAAAIEDARLVLPLPDCGVVIGSSRATQSSWEQLAAQYYHGSSKVNLEDWLETLPLQASITAARYIASNAPVLSPMAACATGSQAIAQGFQLIQQGYCQQVIAGAIEAPISPLTIVGFQQMGALAKTGCYPFDKHRQGLVIGEGAAVLVLESASVALSRNAHIYGQLLGFATSCDAYHVSSPEPSASFAKSSIKLCLERSNLRANEIDYIHAHGTATKLNDLREAKLIQEIFPQVSVSSTKGSTGHTLGASGAMGAAFCLMALSLSQLPPCVGLLEPEFDLEIVTTSRQAFIRRSLCFSFGFGGQNAVLAFARFP